MYVLEGGSRRGSLMTLAALCGLLLLLAVGASDGTYTPTLPVIVIAGSLALTAGTRLLAWRNLLLLFLLVLLFVPIRRFTLSSGAGFQLEPYRVLLFAILPLWGVALLIDPRTRLRKTGFERADLGDRPGRTGLDRRATRAGSTRSGSSRSSSRRPCSS